jgi:hemerythrin-like domain-containing protein
MNIFDLLHDEHEDVLDIIDKMEDTKSQSTRKRDDLVARVKDGLLPHMYAEENYFYPLVSQEANARDVVNKAIDQHKQARKALSETESSTTDEAKWTKNVQMLRHLLEEHIDMEESDIFDMARDVISEDRADEMGDRFEEMEEEAKAVKTSY